MTTTLCHHDGGTGIGAGHVCRCIRISGHPLDSARAHGCSCGALWADEIQRLTRLTPAPPVPPVTVTAEHQRLAVEAIERGWPGDGGDRAPVLLGFSIAAAIAEAEERGAGRALRSAADEWPDAYASSVSDWLHDRADAVVGTNGANGDNSPVDSGEPS